MGSQILGDKKILVSKDLKICGLAVKKVVIVLPKETNIGSFIDQGIDYYRVGVLRGQRHKLSKKIYSSTLVGRASLYQEPIARSIHLPYLPSESTLSRIFLFLEASPTGFFAGVYIVANHKRAVVLYCLRHMQRRKAFAFGRQFFWGAMRTSACFRRKSKNHSRASYFIRSHMTSRPHRLKKTSSMQSKRRDLHHR